MAYYKVVIDRRRQSDKDLDAEYPPHKRERE
jgi:hypothetical protein